ncbi:MAG TPA: aminoglycoside phosphotransferase family protein [Streptosporangiaceae bacterium]|nr:aminoglycoside phosphotransferase family protein [Streptosporangiaceae bacterium]
MDRDGITAEVAARLVAGQFPQWAGLPVVPVGLGGWDNIMFRLGGELSVRLPSGPDYAAQVAKEHRWLPVLAGQLPLPVPEPVALGQPTAGFPWPWSVYRWIEGEPACLGQVTDLTGFAADLARFLAALYAIDASGGPPPGRHNWFRGGSPSIWDEQTRTCIDRLAADIDARAARQVWDSALASPWRHPPVWVHGDITASNLLLADGALHAVIDFGCTAVGDPACDLVMAWTFFPAQAAATFRRGLPADEATWARARGWALWKALITLGGQQGHDGGRAAARQFGWRYSPRQVISRVIADDAACALQANLSALQARLKGGQGHQEQAQRPPGRRELDPVDREVAPPCRLPVRWHRLGVPGQDHLVERFLPPVGDDVYRR